MDSGSEEPSPSLSLVYLKAAFLAMEPVDCVISWARRSGGGAITTGVQSFILEHCINNDASYHTAQNAAYIKTTLKKVIVAVESSNEEVLEGLYEQFAYYMTLHVVGPTQNQCLSQWWYTESFIEDQLLCLFFFQQDGDLLKENNRVYKKVSFLVGGQEPISSNLTNLVIPLQCSLNMLEGDTGCAVWPSSLFLSEFILSHHMQFSNKFCFEIGSGVGLVGITLAHVGSSKLVLTDGDMSSLANLRCNLELNQLHAETKSSEKACKNLKMAQCKYLPWESASDTELRKYEPDIVLGADIIYDPLFLPHLIRVLSILLKPEIPSSSKREANHANGCRLSDQMEESDNDISEETRVAYIATVIRNPATFNYFLRLSSEADLCVCDITDMSKPRNFLPYMFSYDRSSVRLFKVSFSGA